MKKLVTLLCSVILAAVAVLAPMSVNAVGPNLVPNPSVETNASSKPTSWSSDKWGTNTTTFTYSNTGSHSGTYSVTTKMTARSSGDAKWYFSPVTVSPNTSYTFSDWYKSTAKTTLDVEVTSTTGAVSYVWLGDLASSASVWKQANYTFTTPASAAKVTVFHSIGAVGQVTTDDYSLATTASTTPTAPTVSVTAPTAGSTLTGTTALSANAADAQAVASVQFKVDGSNVGAPDTTAPYSVSWDSKTVANGSHNFTAVATNTSGLTTTSSAVAATVSNSVTPTPPTTPTVSISAPAANATVSGTTSVNANASDTTPLAGVQFLLDGVALGAEDTTAPYSVSWDTKTTADGTHILTATARNTSGGNATSSPVSVTVSNPTAPTVNVTAPAANATVSGTTNLTANAADAKAVSSVQFKVDGTNVGTADTTAPYSFAWDSKTVPNGNHTVTAVATNTSNLTTISAAVTFSVNNVVAPVAPTVSITAPAPSATISGTTTITANATDAPTNSPQGITSVQFKLNGANLGTADPVAPYSFAWDTKSVANGTYSLTATATNAAGLTATSSAVNVTVNNVVVTPTPPPTPGNLIANESVESGTPTPTNWTGDGWGTNTRSMTFENAGRTGTHSVKATIAAYTNGDAKWMPKASSVIAGKAYNYSNWYKSNVATELDAEVTMSNGTVQYFWLGSLPASPTDWSKASTQFSAPSGAVSMTIFQVIYSVGYLQTDDFSLTEYTPQKFNRALVSLTFDDGWRSIYTNGYPLLQKYGLTSTQYLNSQPVVDGYPDYMTYQMIKDWASAGHELAWHTRTHADVTKLTATQLNTELTIPAAFLTGTGTTASTFQNFATPFGAYNDTSVNAIMAKYRSHRSTDVGYNTKDNFNIRNIKVQNIVSTTTPAQVKAWVDQAITDQTWLVIVYHEVDTNAADPTYAVTPANLDAELNLIKQSGVTVKTIQQALDEVLAQL